MFAAYNLVPAGVAAFVAAILGIQLGNSAIADIKPNFFLGPAVHPRDRGAAVDPRALEARRLARLHTAYGALYGWDEGNRALQLACLGCGDPVRLGPGGYDARVPYFGSRREAPREDEAAVDDAAAPDDAPEAPTSGLIARYADYPVGQDELPDSSPGAAKEADEGDAADPAA